MHASSEVPRRQNADAAVVSPLAVPRCLVVELQDRGPEGPGTQNEIFLDHPAAHNHATRSLMMPTRQAIAPTIDGSPEGGWEWRAACRQGRPRTYLSLQRESVRA